MTQMEFIQALQQFRSPLSDLFFKSLNFFDKECFYFLLIPVLWFGKNWKAGLRLFAILMLSVFAVDELKQFFKLPRPFHIIPAVRLIQAGGYGFPSGAATNAVLLASLFIRYTNIRFKWVIAILYCFFISLSRLYLGVHFPIDILGGWILGLFFFAVFVKVFPKAEAFLQKQSVPGQFLLSQLPPFSLFLINPFMKSAFIFQGICCSIFCNMYSGISVPPARNLAESFARAAVGVALSFTLYGSIKHLFSIKAGPGFFFGPLLFGFLVGVLGTYICKNIRFSVKK